MKLIIAEKKDQAQRLAAPFPTKGEGWGYIEVLPCLTFPKGAYFSWAAGHLVTLKEPEDYDPTFEKWRMEHLPILPGSFQLKPAKGKEKLFAHLKKLIQNKSFNEIINACDPGREGEAIFTLIYQLSGCKKPVKRLWTSSLTKDAVFAAFQNLLPESEKKNLFYEAYARSCADWLVGINTSRAYSILLREKGVKVEKGESFSTGRVQTPVLALIVEREREIESFVSTPYWEVSANFSFSSMEYRGKWFTGNQDRLMDQGKAEKLAAWCSGKTADIDEISVETKETLPPYLFSLSALQTLANKLFKLSPKDVLDACQTLYDKGYQSYPRTDSNRITTEEAKELPRILENIGKLGPYTPLIPKPVPSIMNNKRYVDASKVSDHYAIIPTDTAPDLSRLSHNERLIYDLVVKSVIAAHYDSAILEHTTIITYVGDQFSFLTKGKRIIRDGWRLVMNTDDPDESEKSLDLLPSVVEGQVGYTTDCFAKEAWTSAPKRLTEGNLISMMKSAGNQLGNKELESIMRKTHGLGTEATRASIISRLKDQSYIEIKKNLVYPTVKGRTLIQAIGQSALSSAETTAKWEQTLSEIGQGRFTHTSFIDQAKKLANKLVNDAVSSVHSMVMPEAVKPNLAMTNNGNPISQPPVTSSPVQSISSLGQSGTTHIKGDPEHQKLFMHNEVIEIRGNATESSDASKQITSSISSSPAKAPPITEAHRRPKRNVTADQNLGSCKKCGQPVIDKGVLYGCSGWENTGCDFKISKTIKGKVIEKETILRILETGSSGLIRGFVHKSKESNKSDTVFDAILQFDQTGKLCWNYPSTDVLKLPVTLLKSSTVIPPSNQDSKSAFAELERETANLKLPAKVIRVTYGPRVTRYELVPAEGLNISHFKRLKMNLKMALKAEKITLYLPIPGTNVIGIEVPSKLPYTVHLRPLLENKEFLATRTALNFPIGMDMSGEPVYADLASMPHLLIAGATGAGKSVFINAMIISLLYSLGPEKLKFLFIDPKMVELSVYENIPHLFGPIVTDVKRAGIALKKLVVEMEKRYELLSHYGVRNIESYYDRVQSVDPNAPRLPYIVLVIDELADLMMTTGADVEECIQRIAQLARAAGIHMIIATQRPSKQVLSPVIKANLPVRVAFAVANHYDSKVILDESGAEDLLGRGDMLYLPKDGAKRRLVSAYVSDVEIENIVSHLNSRGEGPSRTFAKRI
ncbi:DNA topoisomerase 3 [Paenibacillus sp. FSL R5-0473]|uniref:DNA topoisomerase 3 n=1 Tax=Paenibacillus sp. FSL R5-0473 TaxID=2921642 RepID=UPI0030FA90B3